MIVVLKQNVKAEQIEELTKQIEAKGLKVSPVIGTEKSILCHEGGTVEAAGFLPGSEVEQ